MSKGGIILVMILVLILAGGLGIGGVYYYSQPRVVDTEARAVTSCSDSDGQDIYVKGVSSYLQIGEGEDGRSTLTEICDYNHESTKNDVGLVRESYCEDGDALVIDLMTCGSGFVCRQGACVEEGSSVNICEDSDGGKNVNVQGEIYGYGGSGRDDCYSTGNEGSLTNECSGRDCSVWEYYCDGNLKEHEIIPCPNGCLEGACL